MNRQVQRLYEMANRPGRRIIGLMSGTSLDGLDIAVCHITGSGLSTQVNLEHFETIPYADDFRSKIRTVFAQQQVNLETLCLLNPWIATEHARFITAFMKRKGIDTGDIDLIASHGQTIYHAPRWMHRKNGFGNATLQIGDGDHLAVHTGIITISDFRQKHIAGGGEGAPLALYGDRLLFSKAGEDRVLLNIGGIANFTYLPGDGDVRKVISSDTGPGNTLMDAFIQQQVPGMQYDRDAAFASQGSIDEKLLETLKDDPFFTASLPKTTGPELFSLAYVERARHLSGSMYTAAEDIMATLNRFTADTIVAAITKQEGASGTKHIFTSGGGMHNPLLMRHLRSALPGVSFQSTEVLGIDPDAKEAVLFALLANECVAGDATLFGEGAVTMGKISFPA